MPEPTIPRRRGRRAKIRVTFSGLPPPSRWRRVLCFFGMHDSPVRVGADSPEGGRLYDACPACGRGRAVGGGT